MCVNFEAISDDGYLGSPYRAARVFGAKVPERKPRSCTGRAAKLRSIADASSVLPRSFSPWRSGPAPERCVARSRFTAGRRVPPRLVEHTTRTGRRRGVLYGRCLARLR